MQQINHTYKLLTSQNTNKLPNTLYSLIPRSSVSFSDTLLSSRSQGTLPSHRGSFLYPFKMTPCFKSVFLIPCYCLMVMFFSCISFGEMHSQTILSVPFCLHFHSILLTVVMQAILPRLGHVSTLAASVNTFGLHIPNYSI